MAKVQKIHEQVKGVSNAARVRIKHTEEDCEKAVKEFEDKLDGKEKPKDVGGVAGERLNSFILRVERLEEEKAALLEDIKHVYAEAKAVGFDTVDLQFEDEDGTKYVAMTTGALLKTVTDLVNANAEKG